MIANLHGYINNLIDRVLEPETTRAQEIINKLVEDNNTFLNRQELGFNYLGVDYGIDGYARVRGCPALVLSLVPQMAYQVQLKRTIDTDRQTMYLGLTHLLRPCLFQNDLRDALPECVIPLMGLEGTPRTRPEAYTIHELTHSMIRYQKALDKINQYLAMKLLY